jgi:MFS family permease
MSEPTSIPTRRAGLVALMAADLVSALGNWVSVIVLPWLVLESTGSPVKMGSVAAAELVPFLASSVLATPLADRFGVWRTSIATDLGSALAMAAIAAAPRIGYLPLLILVGVAGALRGVGDRTKHVLLAPMAKTAGARMIRVTALYETFMRGTQLIGAPLGGLLIFWFGTQHAIWVDAASFTACAILVGVFVHPDAEPAPRQPEPYLVALRGGARHVWRDRPLFAMIALLFLLNMVTQAGTTVFVPLWISAELHTPAALGVVLAAFALGAVLGGLAFTLLVTRLAPVPTFAAGILISALPRLLVLGGHNLTLVLVVTFVSGLGMSALNPIFGALLYERVPAELQTRVFGLVGAACYAGLPLGAALAGASVAAYGLHTTILLGAAFILVACVPPIRALFRLADA